MKLILDFDSDKCVSCGACAISCMDQNDIDPFTDPPFRHVYLEEQTAGGKLQLLHLSISCMHCEDAPCVKACPVGCIYKDPDTGLTLYDNANCIGCHSCSMACPFGAPGFSAGKMVKCDGCLIRVQHGLQPACVKGCPYDAIQLLTEAEYQEKQNAASLKRMSEEILNRLPR